MLRRAVAALLLVLTVSPFTPPFSTCDISTLFANEIPIGAHPPTLASTVEDGAHTVPLAAAAGRIRARIKYIAQTETAASVHHRAFPLGHAPTQPLSTSPAELRPPAPLRI